ncbi:hypothetical protein BH18ACI5_BH18ACI5_00720 [soil metagenome]
MLQFGGHHLAINLTMAGSEATMAPSLPAAQPATYTLEGRTVRPLGKENDKAFALINALNDAERKQAILSYRVSDLALGPGQDGRTIQPEGIRGSVLSPAQQTMLLDVVGEWSGIMTDAFAQPRMAEIKANLAQTYFAWSGPLTPGSAAYFRIQGPTLVIEYAPQGGVDHIHTIYRDPAAGAQAHRRQAHRRESYRVATVATPSPANHCDGDHHRRDRGGLRASARAGPNAGDLTRRCDRR